MAPSFAYTNAAFSNSLTMSNPDVPPHSPPPPPRVLCFPSKEGRPPSHIAEYVCICFMFALVLKERELHRVRDF